MALLLDSGYLDSLASLMLVLTSEGLSREAANVTSVGPSDYNLNVSS